MSLAKRALDLPQTNPQRKEIEKFLSQLHGKVVKEQKAIYKGKSKNITSKEVTIVSVQGNKTKIRDVEGNEALVMSSQVISSD